MNKFAKSASVLFLFTTLVHAQVPKKRLPQNINVPMYSHIFPSLSGDGNQLLYMTNYTNSDGFELKYTYKTGAEIWADPEPIPGINRPALDHVGSFCLSYDGNFVVFSSRRTPSIGNYDIWISEKIGKNWSAPQNPGKPLNTSGNEGNPSLSPDGKSIYFMRCESMDNTNKNHCRLFVSQRTSANRWSEPEELPEAINAGHETTPRILADNKTMIFASGRNGGKGMLDLYMTSLANNLWSNPISLSYINTDQNDEYISVPARGDLLYFSGPYRDNFNILMAIIPEEFRPQKVMMLTGSVSYDNGQKPSDDVLIQAFDVSSGEVFTTTKLKQDDDSFTVFLPEGTAYDVSAFPQKGGHLYFGQIIDLSDMPISRKEEIPIALNAVRPGNSMTLSTIRFDPYSTNLSNDSDIEIKRIIGFMKKNPGVRIEIGAFMDHISQDSIPSSDLTEIITDTLFFTVSKENTLIQHDDILNDSLVNDIEHNDIPDNSKSLYNDDTLDEESLPVKNKIMTPNGYTFFEKTDTNEIFIKINNTYHNDRTQPQADALMLKLIDMGVPPNLMEAKGYGDDWIEDKSGEERNYWIELKILSN